MTKLQPCESDPSGVQAPTNTLLFTNLHWSVFEDAGQELRRAIETTAARDVVRFVPLSSFFRLVFDCSETAAAVKNSLNGRMYRGNKELKIYFGANAEQQHLSVPSNAELLQVPPTEKNFLLSPPGSPPVGWVQSQESEPSRGGHHAAMLMDALSRLPADDDFSLGAAGSAMPANSMEDDAFDSDRDMRVEASAADRETGGGREYTVEGSVSKREVMERLGVRAGAQTRHILTFGPGSALEQTTGDDGGMEWEVSLPIIVVEDHTSNGVESSDSQFSLTGAMSTFSVNVTDTNSVESLGELPGSVITASGEARSPCMSGIKTPIPALPRTAMPPIHPTPMPPMFQH
ncbi:Calcipressin-domain-containing protein [Chytriomyces sp. MP71]|nr:Calcipressin-domain-containing protein [Chytriomyces sp. MP71]